MENYEKPVMEIVELDQDDIIVTSAGCIIVSQTVNWSDGAGNSYSTTVHE